MHLSGKTFLTLLARLNLISDAGLQMHPVDATIRVYAGSDDLTRDKFVETILC